MPNSFEQDWATAKKARILRDNKQYTEAIYIFTDLLNKYKVSELYFERGSTYSLCGDYINAVKDFTQAIALKDDDADCYINRGNVYLKQKQFNLAIEDFNKAIVLSPHLVQAYNSLAYALQQIGKLNDAIKVFKLAIDMDQTYASPYYNLGVLLIENGRPNEALTYLNRAKELLPNDDDIQMVMTELKKRTASRDTNQL